jgi:hypothetical protein
VVLLLSILAFGVGLWLVGLTIAVTANRRIGPGEVLAAFPVGVVVAAVVPLAQIAVEFRFGWGPLAVAWLAGLVLAALASRWRSRWRSDEEGAWSGSRAAVATGLALLGCFGLAVLALWAAGGFTLETVSQTWDAFFDTNAIRWGYESGDLAPTRISDFTRFEPLHTWYPTTFHALAVLFMQLSGSNAVVASNVAAAAVAGLLWPSTATVGVRALLGRTRLTTVGTLAVQCGFLGMPWLTLGWGVLWATTVAATMVPLVIAGVGSAAGLTGRDVTGSVRVRGGALAAAGVVGILVFHPRVLVTLSVLLFGLWCWWWAEDLWARRRAAGRRRVLAVTVLVGSLAVFLVGVLFIGRHTFQTRRWPVEIPWWEEVYRYVVNAPVSGIPQLTAVLVGFGVVLLLRGQRWRWLVVLFLGAIVLDIITAVTQGMYIFNGLTRFWYNDRYRTVILPAFPGLVVAVIALRESVDRWRRRSAQSPARTTKVIVAACAVLVLWGTASTTTYLTRSYITAAESQRGSVVSPQERAFFTEVAALVPPDAKILNNPNDGSAFLYAYVNRWPVFMVAGGVKATTINGYALRTMMNTEPPVLVCRRFLADDIEYVLTGGLTYRSHVIKADPAPAMEVPEGFPILRKVASGGGYTLWRVHGCPIT